MSTRPRIPALAGAVCACAALLLAGCSSSGTVGGSTSATGGVTGGFAGGTTGGTSGKSGGTTGGGTDTSCQQAMLAIQNAEKAQNSTSAQAALQGVSTSIGQLHAAALTTQKPGGKDAMNKVADDLQNILNEARNGQTPDTQQALTDAQAVATICGM
jgi:hypothetical protein